MTTEYLKKFKSLVAWLIPFLLAVFLLFGCGAPAKNQGITVPDETHTEAQVQAQAQTRAQTRTQTMEAAEAAAPSKSAAKELETSVEQTAFEEATSLAGWIRRGASGMNAILISTEVTGARSESSIRTTG